MEDQVKTVLAVIQTLKNLFSEKASLNGFDDWDSLIGCVVALDNVANALRQPEEKAEE